MTHINNHIAQLRTDYAKGQLDESSVEKNPFKQFEKWMHEAIESQLSEANAMTLATADKNGKPTLRVVLLREYSEKGFSFYSNYTSKKGTDIAQNPYAALNFFWIELQRQIRIEGVIEKLSTKESDDYFNSRPHESKIGAWVSEQSQAIKNRNVLDEKFEALSKKYLNNDVPRPPYWGGYLLKPTSVEFWQGRPSRLHDRIQYTISNNNWLIERLAP